MGGGHLTSDPLPHEHDDFLDASSSVEPTLDSSSSSDASSRDESHLSDGSPSAPPPLAALWRQTASYLAALGFYEDAYAARDRSLQDLKDLIRRHKPGDWMEAAGGTAAADYEIPAATTLLLIGPRGSGKSTLVNRITRVFDDDQFAPERAQVSHNLVARGSYFLQEYMIPRNSGTLCVYDTRGLSVNRSDNLKMLERWMTKGVSHGEMVIWDSDDVDMKKKIKSMARQGRSSLCQKRTVNFAILVLDGNSILNSIKNKGTGCFDMIDTSRIFSYPFLSFKDSKPVVVVTHGDMLSPHERARVRGQLVELLGIPMKQIFDIPDINDHHTELAVLDMLWHCIHHADQNLPFKHEYLPEFQGPEIFRKMKEKLLSLDAIIEAVTIFLVIIIFLCAVYGEPRLGLCPVIKILVKSSVA